MSYENFSAKIDDRHGPSVAERIAALPAEERERRLSRCSQEELASLRYNWEYYARPNQLIPECEWQTWLVKAGRGFGKTRIGAETMRKWSKDFEFINIIAPTADDARDICIEGESGILAICPHSLDPKLNERPVYLPSKRRLEWPSGAVSLIFTADEPERLRGKQHQKLWCEELMSWRYLNEAWTQAMLGLRLGTNPQSIVTTTPKPHPVLMELMKSKNTFLTSGTTYDNRRNLAKAFYSRIIVKYEGTRLGRQELNAEILEDNPDALFHRSDIDATRCDHDLFWNVLHEKLRRIVGSIDPAATSNEESDETGIIFAGALEWKHLPEEFRKLCKHQSEHYFVFDDRSDIYTPDGWAKAALSGYVQFKADRLVGEVNNGGEMIEATLRHADPNVAYTALRASRGKQTRAEPISALYEQRRVHHVGNLSKLEDQLCDWNPKVSTDSPDRLDADVWVLTELAEGNYDLGPMIEMMQREAAAITQQQAQGGVVVALKIAPPGTCPACASLTVVNVSGSMRCMECGEQWQPAGAARAPYHVKRGDVLAGRGI